MSNRYDCAVKSPYLLDGSKKFSVAKAVTASPKNAADKKQLKKALAKSVDQLEEWQRRLYAADTHSLLVVFQAMDAAGKDSTIRSVFSGVDPAGFQVTSFKAPSNNELDHDYLWRTAKALPQRGRIGVFNRSYYEETLVVRVHPEYLGGQKLPHQPNKLDDLWIERLESIADHEKHLARNGTAVVKFWLNVSRDEQKNRFLDRIDRPEKNWKFNPGDVSERGHWDAYMNAYEDSINATAKPWAPWYAIPADDKPFMRATVADILVKTLEKLNPAYPTVTEETQNTFASMRASLEAEKGNKSKAKK